MQATFDNRTPWERNNKLIFAIYEEDTLVDVVVQEFCATKYDVTKQTTIRPLTIPQNLNSTTIKAFIWDNTNLKPVVENYEVSLK